MDLESLRREIDNEIQRLDQRRSALMEKVRNLGSGKETGLKGQPAETPPPGPSNENPLVKAGLADLEDMLAALRCLKCGSSLKMLIPTDAAGEPNISSPRLGQSEGGDRFFECPHCYAKNIFVRTTGPRGWRLLVTRLNK